MIRGNIDPQTLAELRALCAEQTGKRPEDVTLDEIEAYLAEAEARGPSLRGRTLSASLEAHAETTPEAIALATPGATITRAALRAAQRRAGAWLRARGAGPGSIVACSTSATPEAVAAWLGVFRAGAALLALDPADPPRHLARVLDRARAATSPAAPLLILADASTRGALAAAAARLPPRGPTVALVDVAEIGAADEADLPDDPGAIAYVVHVSGRLVAVSHDAAASRLEWLSDTFSLAADDVVLLDGSPRSAEDLVRDVLWPLVSGARVALAGAADRAALEALGVTVAHLSPQSISRWTRENAESAPPALRLALTSGEPLKQAVVDAFARASRAALHALCTVPEAAGEVLIHACRAGEARATVPLGRPAASSVYVLDRHLRPAPVGVPGELYVSSDALAVGYLGDAAETAQRFVPDPFDAGARMFRTGEHGRLLEGGTIDRVAAPRARVRRGGIVFEPAEVTAALVADPEVRGGVVIARDGGAARDELVAYALLAPSASADAVLARLAESLPEGERPSAIVPIARLPLTPDGDVDDAALARLDIADADLVARWEARLGALPEVAEVAAIVRPHVERAPALHLSDLLPSYRTLTGHGSAPSASVEAPAGGASPPEVPAVADGGPAVAPPDAPHTLDEALARAAENPPDRGLVFLDASGAASTMSYAELYASARRVLGGLLARGLRPGDKVILQLEHNRDVVVAYWACVLGGLLAVPIGVPPSYREPNAVRAKLTSAWRWLGKPVVVTSRAAISEVRSLEAELGAELTLAPIEDLAASEPAEVRARTPDDLAVLLLTSGSTGLPKGVPLRDRNILARTFSMASFIGLSEADVTLNWMPLDHVVGLVMYHTRDVILRARQIHAATSAVLKDPLLWLDWLDRYRVTVTWAPNFAFGLVNREEARAAERRWDLSSVRIIQNGAEPVVARTARRFLRLCLPHQLRGDAMYPGWGMSETSSAVSFALDFRLDSTGDDDSFVELGAPIPGFAMRIVDLVGRLVGEGAVGRLQVKGASVFAGYWDNAALNREVITDDGWFDTGDLGFLRRGRLTLTGREKDVIIVNGINYASHEIESAVEEVRGVLPSFTAACAVRRPGSETDGVAIFFAPRAPSAGLPLDLCAEIRERVTKALGLRPDHVFPVDKAEIPKTSIGKIQRSVLVRAFAEGRFDATVKALDLESRNDATLPSFFFEPTWIQENPVVTPSLGAELRGARALLVGGGELAVALTAELEAAGLEVTRAEEGAAFADLGGGRFQVRLAAREDYERVIAGRSFQAVVHLVRATDPGSDLHAPIALTRASERGVFGLLALYQALAGAPAEEAPLRFFVAVSRTALVADDDVLAPDKAPIVGFLRTLALEAPSLDVRRIDLDRATPAESAARLARELASPRAGEEVAYRNGRRYVSALARAPMDAPARRDPFRRGGLYVVTGGLGGVGSAVAERLLRHYGLRLLLVGRTRLPERSEWAGLAPGSAARARAERLVALEKAGGEVVYESADVGDIGALRAAVQRAEARFGQKLAGVLHLAGEGDIRTHLASIERRTLKAESRESFDAAFRAKIAGTRALFELTGGDKDALFVAFSSVNGVLGGASFGAYSAASSYLDAFVLDKRRRGFASAFSLDWATWDGLGMNEGAPAGAREGARQMGYCLLSADQGFSAMLACLSRDRAQVLVGVDGDHPAMRARTRGAAPRAQEIAAFAVSRGPLPDPARLEVRDRLGTASVCALVAVQALPRDAGGAVDRAALARLASEAGPGRARKVAPRTDTEEQVLAIWTDVLGTRNLGVFDNFFELGGHSLRATQVVARLRDALRVELPLQRLFEAPTIAGVAEVIDALRGTAPQREAEAEGPSFAAVPREGALPLSFAQERLWFLDQLEPNSAFYNLGGAVRLRGALDVDALRASLAEVARRHEVLRSTFASEAGGPVQVIHPEMPLAFAIVDLAGVPAGERDDAVRRELAAELQRPFDLARGPLFRAKLVLVSGAGEPGAAPGEREAVLGVTMHHTISDGWSVGVLVREVAALYPAIARGEAPALPPLPFQYVDYAVGQRRWLAAGVLDREVDAWKARLAGAETSLDLPTDRPRPAVQTYRGKRRPFTVPAGLVGALRELGRREDATLFMVLAAAFDVLLARYTGKDDVLLGTPIAGRRQASTEALIGFFLNTVVLRADLSGDPSFRELVARVRDAALFAYAHQDVPFERLVNDLGVPRDLSRSPLFQVMLVLQNTPMPPLELPGLRLELVDVDPEISQFDWLLSFEEDGAALRGSLQYNTDLFDAATIDRAITHLLVLVEAAALDPDRRVSELPLLPAAERRTLLEAWNATARAYPEGLLLHELFEAQVDRTPDVVAVSYEGQELTYRELDRHANRLAHHLRKLGVARDVLVGVCMERSIELVVALYGIVKAGGAYVPIDPSYPKPRIAFFLDDARAPVLLTQARLAPTLPAHDAKTICLDAHWGAIEREPDARLERVTDPEGLAYVIYTSGSTGQPKGAMNTHAGIVNRLLWMQEAFALTSADRVLQKTPYSFDVSVWELFWPLLAGARLVVARPEGHKDPAYLADTIVGEGVTVLHFVPSMLAAFLEHGGAERCASVRTVVASGEALTVPLVERFHRVLPGAALENLYGPTEAAVDVTHYSCTWDTKLATVPIGKAIANTHIYVLDPRGEPAPIGVPGELHIGGVQLARGYWSRPELTAERFVAATAPELRGERLYKTGDRARVVDGGTVEYLGRLDHQVKLRGFRIELGEIEAALARVAGVRAATVVVREDAPGERRLVAYVVAESAALSAADLRAALKDALPDYMVPSAVVFLGALPLTTSGKVDRRALPAPEPKEGASRGPYVAPRTPVEDALAGIFAGVLRLERVGVDESFFELGGDSILSIQVVSRAKERGIHLTPKLVFQHQTVADLAQAAQAAAAQAAPQGPVTGPAPLTPVQRWFFEEERAEPHHFNQALLLEVDRRLEREPLARAVAALLEHHDALRLRFTRGADGWSARFAPPGEPPSVVELDLSPADATSALPAEAARVQASLSLEDGPLVRVALIRGAAPRRDRLLLVIHHLAVDGVSWRVLLEDLWTAYQAAASGERAALPAKTTSYREWALRLEARAASAAVRAELEGWLREAERRAPRLPVDHPAGRDVGATAASLRRELSEDETRRLRDDAPAAYRTTIGDLLLAALALATHRWTGQRRLSVALEGHGREAIADDVDTTRTVGWFTAIYPVTLEIDPTAGPGEVIKAVKEQLRAVPGGGLGYGLLRYLGAPAERERLARAPEPELLFNYLGQLDQGLPETSPLRLAEGGVGPLHSPRDARRFPIDLTCQIAEGRLTMTWMYASERHDEATIAALADGFAAALSGLVAHCLAPEAGGYTPSDFKRVKLRADVLDSIVSRLGAKRPK